MDQHKLLIIEEDRSSRDALQNVFISRGWEVAMATTQDEGLRILRDYDPDWIIVAWQQLNGAGTQFVRHARRQGRPTRLGVLTDELTSTERAMLKRLQPDIAVAKPFVAEVVFGLCVLRDPRLATAS